MVSEEGGRYGLDQAALIPSLALVLGLRTVSSQYQYVDGTHATWGSEYYVSLARWRKLQATYRPASASTHTCPFWATAGLAFVCLTALDRNEQRACPGKHNIETCLLCETCHKHQQSGAEFCAPLSRHWHGVVVKQAGRISQPASPCTNRTALQREGPCHFGPAGIRPLTTPFHETTIHTRS